MKLLFSTVTILALLTYFLINSINDRWYDQAMLKKGAQLYQQNCAGCHKSNTEGTIDWKKRDNNGNLPPPPLNGTAHTWHHSKEALIQQILEGGTEYGGTMPGFKKQLSITDAEAIISYFQSKWTDDTYAKWESR